MGKLQLRDFQKEDVAFMKHHNYRVLVANGQGTGKTIECLAAISIDRKMLSIYFLFDRLNFVFFQSIDFRFQLIERLPPDGQLAPSGPCHIPDLPFGIFFGG